MELRRFALESSAKRPWCIDQLLAVNTAAAADPLSAGRFSPGSSRAMIFVEFRYASIPAATNTLFKKYAQALLLTEYHDVDNTFNITPLLTNV